jgi:hypothetical protein
MTRLPSRVGVALLLVLVTHLIGADEGLAQALDLRPGDRVMASLSDPSAPPLEGSVTDLWEGGLSIRTRGQPTARRVDLGDLSSLQRSRRLGGRAQKGALIVGGGLALAGYGLVCGLSSSSGDGCSRDEANAFKVGLILGVPGALLGAGIGALFGHYGPFEPVNLDGSARRSNANRLRMKVMPGETGGVSVRLAVTVGGGA